MNTIHQQPAKPLPGLARLVTPRKVVSFFAVNAGFEWGRIRNNVKLRLASRRRKKRQAVVLRNNPPSAKFGYRRMSRTIFVSCSSVG